MRRFVYTVLVRIVNALQDRFIGHERLYRLLLAAPLDSLRRRLGAWRAWFTFQHAYRTVPAYREFIDAQGGLPPLRQAGGLPDLTVIPEIDKDSYVRRYDHASRCVGGEIPRFGVVVDESSGSSGTPTSWVRGPHERWATKHMLQLAYRSALGPQSFFVINAFALGAWATGLNVTLSLSDVCIMKSTGPDIRKIVGTMREFGPGYDYVVMGYPPFLKTLADDRDIDWERYSVRAIFGGEAISESLRRYLLRTFDDVRGSYGASDLEINMAAESPFTIALRQELQRNGELRRRLTRADSDVLPMVFQYNPLAYHFETNDAGELVATLVRPIHIAPKIRYNIHDLGHAMPFAEVERALEECGLGDLLATTDPVRLPLLLLYGRSDLSVDYFGANVTPGSVSEILYAIDDIAPSLESFRLISTENEHHDVTLEVAIELTDGADPDAIDRDGLAAEVFDRLADRNGDFANAYRRTATEGQLPVLTVHARGTGPFAGDERLKKQYIGSGAGDGYQYDPLR